MESNPSKPVEPIYCSPNSPKKDIDAPEPDGEMIPLKENGKEPAVRAMLVGEL